MLINRRMLGEFNGAYKIQSDRYWKLELYLHQETHFGMTVQPTSRIYIYIYGSYSSSLKLQSFLVATFIETRAYQIRAKFIRVLFPTANFLSYQARRKQNAYNREKVAMIKIKLIQVA